MFWVWFAAITLATIAGIVVCVAQVINSIEIMKHKKRTWLDITIVCILDAKARILKIIAWFLHTTF